MIRRLQPGLLVSPRLRLAGLGPARPLHAAMYLAGVIRRLQPDLIHTQEIHRAGSLTLGAKKELQGDFPRWIVGNWGLETHLSERPPRDSRPIEGVLSNCDYYLAECDQDEPLIRTLGLRGEVLPVFPIGEGFDTQKSRTFRQPEKPSDRRLVLLEGSQDLIGRALIGLRAIELSAEVLEGHRVAVYSADPEVKTAAEQLARSAGVPIEIVPKVTREAMLRLHGQARVSIGLNIGHGLDTSALAAILTGALPIQAGTRCTSQWIQDGVTGLLVQQEDPAAVAAALRRSMTDDVFVQRAAEANAGTASQRLDVSVIRRQTVAMYRSLARLRCASYSC